MKNLVFLVAFLPLLSSACRNSDYNPQSAEDPQKDENSRNRAYIKIENGSTYNYPKDVFAAINRFEDEKGVEVIFYVPQIDVDSEQLRGVWVTFEEIPAPKSQGLRPTYQDGILILPPTSTRPSRAERAQ